MHGKRRSKKQHGFTIMQMVVTVAIIAILSTVGVLGITRARAQYRLQNSARVFASYIEKARADSVRRHSAGGSQSSVQIFGEGTNTYSVTMDFGSGLGVETRSFQLEPGITFGTAAQTVTFDWRGRLVNLCPVTKACVFQVESNFLGDRIPVDVSGSGDITVGAQHFPDQLIPEVAMADVPDDVDHPTPTPTPASTPDPSGTPPIQTDPGGDTVDPTPTPTPGNNGNGQGPGGNNGNGNSTPTPTPTPYPTPTPSPGASPSPIPQCLSTISPSSLELSQSAVGYTSGTAVFTMVNATGVRTISATQAGNGNSMVISLSQTRVDGNGTSIITVETKHGAGNRGTFTIDVAGSPACGTTPKLTVYVSN